jgi:hypothetical protein
MPKAKATPPPEPEPAPVKKKATPPPERVAPPASVIERLLTLEPEVQAEAAAYPSGANSDAVKYALAVVAGRIGALRNAIDSNRRLERP